MYSNGLLEHYKNTYYREGFLDVSKLKIVETPKQSVFDTCVSCKSPVGFFYKKYHNYFSKEMADAEILLSQLYNKLGLTSAVYLPAQEKGHRFLLSNSVNSGDTIQASNFKDKIESKLGCSSQLVDGFMGNQVGSSIVGKEIVNYFSQKALAQQVKMRVLDCASNNPDRQDCNYVYKIDQDGVAQDIVVFDHERSGLKAWHNIMQRENGMFMKGFCNDFGLKDATKMEVIDTIKQSELCTSVIDTHSLAEEIGSIDVNAVALDICRTTGYMVEPSYTDYIAKSFNMTANYLEK